VAGESVSCPPPEKWTGSEAESKANVNIIKQFKTNRGWKMASLDRDAKGRIKWSTGPVTYRIE
jgi:hypothetical protein